jgi:GDP/UDP-N,N'-diacetylbacillosamine 2-epimerase (hydrolysing)
MIALSTRTERIPDGKFLMGKITDLCHRRTPIMPKVAVCTFARSEYGLLRQVIRRCAGVFDTSLIAGGWHFQNNSGSSIQEIMNDRLLADEQIHKIPFVQEQQPVNNPLAVVSQGIISMHHHLSVHPCDLLVVMGDRHELFAATLAALHLQIPVAHISGGEISEGAIDDSIRHATTKLSHLHLTANSDCALRLSRMGEEDWRIAITGEPGLDTIHANDIATPEEVYERFGVDISRPLLLVTMHPSTLEPGITLHEQFQPLAEVLKALSSFRIIITSPAPEQGAETIASEWQQLDRDFSHISYIPHLGSRNYLAAMRNAYVVAGNSSSGLTEAPSLGIPSVNIGGRQRGRMAAESVIHCSYSGVEIEHALKRALSEDHQTVTKQAINPYDPYRDGLNSERVMQAIRKFLELPFEQQISKKFNLQTNASQWDMLLKL